MALRVCLECSCRYAVGLQVCPQCGALTRNAIYDWEDDVAKASAEAGATFYLPEGHPVPADLPDGVRLVGPGAPAEAAEAPEPAPEVPEPPQEAPEAAPPPVSAPKADWVAHAAEAGVLPADEAAALTKADLVETVKAAKPIEPANDDGKP